MLLNLFTAFHVVLSLIGIASGLVVLGGFLASKRLNGWATLFLTTTAATSLTGFLFPFHGFLPSYAVGALSLVVLAVAVYARGRWRKTYVITSSVALYLNVFVLIAQMFQKIPALKALAPTQTETPFQIAQAVVLLLFVVLTTRAVIRFHPTGAQLRARGAGA